MSIPGLITELQAATRADRKLDEKIAVVAGWIQVPEIVPGANGKGERRLLWFYPGEQASRLPRFTGSIDSALELVGIIAPGTVGGFTWGGPNRFKRGKAQLNEAAPVEAANTAIALCIAALKDAASRSD